MTLRELLADLQANPPTSEEFASALALARTLPELIEHPDAIESLARYEPAGFRS
jgi:hypothetical protein